MNQLGDTGLNLAKAQAHMELNPGKKYLQDAASVSQTRRDVMNKGLDVLSSTAHKLRNLRFSLPGSIPQQSSCLRVCEPHIHRQQQVWAAP